MTLTGRKIKSVPMALLDSLTTIVQRFGATKREDSFILSDKIYQSYLNLDFARWALLELSISERSSYPRSLKFRTRQHKISSSITYNLWSPLATQ